MVIPFPANSSYFSADDDRRLRSLLERLDRGEAHTIALTATVGTSTRIAGAETPAEAMRYHRWLAERRVERIRDWFEGRSDGWRLDFQPRFEPSGDARQVTVEILNPKA